MKKIKIIVLAFLLAALPIFASCESNTVDLSSMDSSEESATSTADERIPEIDAIYNAYEANGGTLSYDEWIASIKGEKGETGQNGQDGQDGEDGKDGVTPQIRVHSETNEWEVSYDNGKTWSGTGAQATVSTNGDCFANSAYIRVGANRDFQTIQDAVYSVVDASVQKPYTILVDEGTYVLDGTQLNFIPLKSYVRIEGLNKTRCHIVFKNATKAAWKNVFQNDGTQLRGGVSEVSNFTITTDNIKGTLHLDDASWSGKVYFHDIIIDQLSAENEFNPELDYYNYMDASFGAINLSIYANQTVHIENVVTNGYIYSHTGWGTGENLEIDNGGTFIVKNCVCDWLAVYGNGEVSRKNAYFENNKCKFIKISFLDWNASNFMAWNVHLSNNETDFIQDVYMKTNDATHYSLWDDYYGRAAFVDSNLHAEVQNVGKEAIVRGDKLKFTDDTKRYVVKVEDTAEYDAVAIHAVAADAFGTVQYGGDKEAFLQYLTTH